MADDFLGAVQPYLSSIWGAIRAPFQAQPSPQETAPAAPAYQPASDTYGWAYAPPSHLEGEPAVPISDRPPGAEIAPNQAVRLPSGVVAYRQTYAEHDRLAELDRQAQQAAERSQQAIMDARTFALMAGVAKSTKDIEIAKRSIDMMGLQRDIQAGMPLYEAVQRHPLGLGSSYPAALQHSAPPQQPFTPTAVTIPGMPPAVRSGRYGERIQFAPPSSIQHELDTTGAVLKDPESGRRLGAVYRTGPNTQHIILDKMPNNVTPQTANQIYNAQERSLAKELGTTAAMLGLGDPNDPQHAYFTDLQNQLKAVRANRAALLQSKAEGGGTEGPTLAGVKEAGSTTRQKPVAVLGQGTKTDPARPTTNEEFASVPSGAYYINPKDGKLYQKK